MWIITIININNIYLYIYIYVYSQWDPVIKVYRWQWNLPIELQRECHNADLLECNSQPIRESSWRLIYVSITTPVITIIIIIICCINIMRHSWMIEISLIDGWIVWYWLMDFIWYFPFEIIYIIIILYIYQFSLISIGQVSVTSVGGENEYDCDGNAHCMTVVDGSLCNAYGNISKWSWWWWWW
jgi:hypothetical protein